MEEEDHVSPAQTLGHLDGFCCLLIPPTLPGRPHWEGALPLKLTPKRSPEIVREFPQLLPRNGVGHTEQGKLEQGTEQPKVLYHRGEDHSAEGK